MASKKMRIIYLDKDPLEVRLGPKAQVDVERHFDLSIVDMGRVDHIYYMAWTAANHRGLEPRTYDEFLDAIDDVEMVDTPPPGPTEPGPPPGSSSS